MTDNVFGGRQDSHVDAFVECGVEEWSSPGIVKQRNDIMLFGSYANRGDILHLKGQATWIFKQYSASPVTETGRDVLGQRIEVPCLDTEALQEPIGKTAARIICVVGHHQHVAGFQDRKQRSGNCCYARRI